VSVNQEYELRGPYQVTRVVDTRLVARTLEGESIPLKWVSKERIKWAEAGGEEVLWMRLYSDDDTRRTILRKYRIKKADKPLQRTRRIQGTTKSRQSGTERV
jgi:hypothetical protein